MNLAIIRDLFPNPILEQFALIGPRCLALTDREKALIETCLECTTEESIVQAYRGSPLFTARLESMLQAKQTLDDYWSYSGGVAGGCAGAYLGGYHKVVEMATRVPSPIGEMFQGGFLSRAVGTLFGVYCGSHLARAAAVRLPVNRKIAERREEQRNPLINSAEMYHEEQRLQAIEILCDVLGENPLLNDQDELKRFCIAYNQRVMTQELYSAQVGASLVSQLSDRWNSEGFSGPSQRDERDESEEVALFYGAQPNQRRAVAQAMLADLAARDQLVTPEIREKILACADSPRLITLPNEEHLTYFSQLSATSHQVIQKDL